MDRLVEDIRRRTGSGCTVSVAPSDLNTVRTDQSGIVGDLPICVVRPELTSDVAGTVRACARVGVAIVPRGGGTGLEGGAVPQGRCVVIDTSSMTRVIKISPEDRTAHVEAGMTPEHLNSLVGEHGLFFPVSPTGAAETATVGGLISTNARGMYACRYGSAGDNLLGLDVVTADGRCAFLGHRVPHSSSGFNIERLFTGAEGTLGVIVGAVLRLHPVPLARETVLVRFNSLARAAAFCAEVAAYIPEAAAVELVSAATTTVILAALPDSGFGPDPANMVMIELHAGPQAVHEAADRIRALAGDHAGGEFIAAGSADIWETRHRFTRAISAMSEAGRPFRFDAAVPLTSLARYVAGLERASARIAPGLPTCIFGHAAAGIVHVLLPAGTDRGLWGREAADTLRKYAIRSALRYGGTVSGEHGIGMTTVDELRAENRGGVRMMTTIKRCMDPKNLMNPGKVLKI